MSTLVVYFSRKGYVRSIAERLAREQDADLLEIKTPERTQGVLGFWWCGRFGMHRWPMPLEPYTVDPAAYDRVLICAPVWVLSLCAPMWAFLRDNAGKIKRVEYTLVHFSFPMRYVKTRRAMDKLLGVEHERFTSVVCQLGRIIKTKVYDVADAKSSKKSLS